MNHFFYFQAILSMNLKEITFCTVYIIFHYNINNKREHLAKGTVIVCDFTKYEGDANIQDAIYGCVLI